MRKILLMTAAFLASLVVCAQVPQIDGYQYWFDGQFSSAVSLTTSPITELTLNTPVSVSGLSTGLHRFNIRFRDDAQKYSSVSSTLFYNVNPFQINGYQYWFDQNSDQKTIVSITPVNMLDLNDAFSTASLPVGMHLLHIRFRDASPRWSIMQTSMFFKMGGAGNHNLLTSYEYWFDSNPQGRIVVPLNEQPAASVIAPIDASALPSGLHCVHIRFKTGDLAGIVSSNYFYKSGQAGLGNNTISRYRFWFDNDPSNMQYHHLAQPASDLILLEDVELPYLTLGKHLMSVEFSDTLGKYSSVVNDSVNILTCTPYPAKAISGPQQVCAGSGGIIFSIPAVTNATGYSWTLPAGSAIVSGANTNSIVVDFSRLALSGTISVSATNPCSAGPSSSLAITVNPLPAPVIAGDTVVCSGAANIAYLTESGHTGYTWNVTGGGSITSGTGSAQIVVSWFASDGYQRVTAGFLNSFGCYDTASVRVHIKPLPPAIRTLSTVSIADGQTLCGDATDTLVVPGNGNTFQLQPGGNAVLMAGKAIRIMPGTMASAGGYLHGYITADCFYCNAIPHTLPQVMREESLPELSSGIIQESSTGNIFKVYPNPTTGDFTIEIADNQLSVAGMIEIYGMKGEKIITKTLDGTRKHEMSLSDQPAGIYIIRMMTGGISSTSRIIKY